MPIKIPNDLPASKILKEENIFVMDENRALAQQIRPLQLLILNIMPTKVVTETQLLPPFAQVVEAADNINVHEKKIIRNVYTFVYKKFVFY